MSYVRSNVQGYSSSTVFVRTSAIQHFRKLFRNSVHKDRANLAVGREAGGSKTLNAK